MAPMSSAAGYVEQLPLPGKAFRNGRAPRGAECAPVRRTRARAGQRWCERGSLTTFRTIPLYESRWPSCSRTSLPGMPGMPGIPGALGMPRKWTVSRTGCQWSLIPYVFQDPGTKNSI